MSGKHAAMIYGVNVDFARTHKSEFVIIVRISFLK
jgi:hypothetical protein